jgi:hypothetical protein
MLESGNMGWLNNTAISSTYLEKTNKMSKPIDCMWIVNVTKDWKVREGLLSCNYFVHSNLVYIQGMFKKKSNFLNSAPTSTESALRLLSAPSARY